MRYPLWCWLTFGVAVGLSSGCDDLKKGTSQSSESPAQQTQEIALANVTFDGVESAIASAKGNVVLVDCWATWCGPCVSSFPKLIEKHNKYASQGLSVISISLDDAEDADQVKGFLKKRGATFTNLHLMRDNASETGMKSKFAYEGSIPHAVLFNRTGERVWAGHPMDPKLDSAIKQELAN